MVIDTGPKKLAKSNALRSGRRRPFQKDLTGLALFKMSGNALPGLGNFRLADGSGFANVCATARESQVSYLDIATNGKSS